MYGIYESGQVIARFVAPMGVKSNVPVFASDTLSLSRPTSARTAQRWEIETRLEPLSFNAQDLFVNLVVNGYTGVVQVLMPQNYGAIQARGTTSGGTGSGGVDATTITISGMSGLMPKGTFVRFSNHNKVYMTTSDRSGNGSVGIFPALRTSISGTTMDNGDDVLGNFRYDFDTVTGMSFTDGVLQDVGIVKLVEDV